MERVKTTKKEDRNTRRDSGDQLNQLIGQLQKQQSPGTGLDAHGGAAATSCSWRIYCV